MQIKKLLPKSPYNLYLIYGLIISTLLAFGLFLRINNLSSQPYWMDEGYTINAVLSIKENGTSILDSGNSYNCPMYCYPTHYFTTLFGDNSFSYRLLSVISGVLLILIIFFTTRKITNNKIALLSSFFLTFSYYEIAWSRQARWYTLFSLLFLISVYLFYQAYKTKNKKYIILTTVFTLLTIFTHSLGILLPFAFLLFIFIEKIFKDISFKKIYKNILIFFSVAILLIALDYILNIRLLLNGIKNFSLSFNLLDYLLFYIKNYSLFIILIIASLFLKNKYTLYTRLIFVVIMTYLIPLSFFTEIVNYRYLFQLVPFIFILGSISIISILDIIKNKFIKASFLISILVIYFALSYGVLYPKDFYFLESDISNKSLYNKKHYSYTPQPNWNNAYKIIKENRETNDIVISNEPQFNKIFLNETGYYLKYDRNGLDDKTKEIKEDREYYVDAMVINDLEELKEITKNNHGYIVFDYLFVDKNQNIEILNYIKDDLKLKYFNRINEISSIWVYRF